MKVLGLSLGELSTAAILIDGEIVACASEERFSRVKNDESYPRQAIEYCLEYAGVDGTDLDHVAIASYQADLWHRLTHYYSRFSIRDFVREQHEYWYPTLYEKRRIAWQSLFRDKWDLEQYPGTWSVLADQMGDSYYLSDTEMQQVNEFIHDVIHRHLGVPKAKISQLEHHTVHAAYAYWASPFRQDRTLILTADGYGDGLSATVSVADKDVICRLKAISHRDFQIGRMYRYATLLLGMKPNEHEYKVMGLSAYAKPPIYEQPYRVYRNTMYVDDLDFKYRERPTDMYFYFRDRLEGCRFDGIAGGVQKYSEEVLTEWTANALRQTGTDRLVLSGGVAMNIKSIKYLAELKEVRDLFVAPSAGDESLAIGACYHVCRSQYGVVPRPLKDVYLGLDISMSEVKEVIENVRRHGSSHEITERVSPDVVARRLADGRVIARCAGRMEFGARALGNRSILADPRSPENVRIINEKVKNRDFWMPFAPAVLAHRASRYLVNPKGIRAPFMTIAFDTTERGSRELVAATHTADKTARPQMVEREVNPEFADIIQSFEAITGVGGVLNTSFNLHGEPIVCGATDALRVFELTDIDDLLLGSTLISKWTHDEKNTSG